MNKILLFDTAVSSKNMGDQIIMDAVNAQLRRIFPYDFFLNVPTHSYIDKHSYQLAKEAKYIFVGGTNLLTARMNRYNQWRIGLRAFLKLSNVVLLGVGWWQYQTGANLYTRVLLKKVLSKRYAHSLRDNYTLAKFQNRILANGINTGCPTMWDLTEDHCAKIPRQKGESVVFTITDYKPNPAKDIAMYKILSRNYSRIFLWTQGSKDYAYARRVLPIEKIEILEPSLKGFDELLSGSESLDYIGTRLHAGIRAMQNLRRSIIIGVDNRAREKKKDFNVPVVDRSHIETDLESLIKGNLKTEISIPIHEIDRWKRQFAIE